MIILTELDKSSDLWVKIKKGLEEQLTIERESNDHRTDELTTAARRGRIEVLKELLSSDSE